VPHGRVRSQRAMSATFVGVIVALWKRAIAGRYARRLSA
jgi:hypothetical protein